MPWSFMFHALVVEARNPYEKHNHLGSAIPIHEPKLNPNFLDSLGNYSIHLVRLKKLALQNPWRSIRLANRPWWMPRCHDARDQPCISLCLSWLSKDEYHGSWRMSIIPSTWTWKRTIWWKLVEVPIFWTRIKGRLYILSCNKSNIIRKLVSFHTSRSSSAHTFKLWRMTLSNVRFLCLNKGKHQVAIVHIQSYSYICQTSTNRNSVSNTGGFLTLI